MCQPQTECMNSKQSSAMHTSSKNKKSLLSKVWPLPTPLVLALVPLLPTTFYINRGYTVWFHLLSMVYLFTRSPFIRKMLILQGTGICLGWYCAIVNEYLAEGGFCHTLYRNMPGGMLPYMVQEHGSVGNYTILDGQMSLLMKGLSHVLDTLGHPGLAYLFWKLEVKSQSTTTTASTSPNERNNNSTLSSLTLRNVLTMPVIVASWHLSRTWSLVHSYYNTGTPKFWYYGHDVYLLDNLDSYLIAYIAEGVCFGVAILCRMYWDRVDQSPTTKSMEPSYYENVISGEKLEDDSKPSLVHSESAMSTSSISS